MNASTGGAPQSPAGAGETHREAARRWAGHNLRAWSDWTTDELAAEFARVEAAALRERDEAMAALRAVLAPLRALAATPGLYLPWRVRTINGWPLVENAAKGAVAWASNVTEDSTEGLNPDAASLIAALTSALPALLTIADQSAATAPVEGDARPIRALASERPAAADGKDSSRAPQSGVSADRSLRE